MSGLPYNIFPTHVSRSIIRRLVSMLKEDGTLSFFEYAAIRNLRRVVGSRDMKPRADGMQDSWSGCSAIWKAASWFHESSTTCRTSAEEDGFYVSDLTGRSTDMPGIEDILGAHERIRDRIRTPVITCGMLDEICGRHVF